MKYCVYLHYIDGEEEPFYVGVSSNLKRPYNFTVRSKEWIEIYKEVDGRIRVEIIEVASRDEAKEKENELVRKYKHSVCNKATTAALVATDLLLPRLREITENLGTNIKLARLRRNLSASQLAMRANISRPTYWRIEKGDPSIQMCMYVKALFAMGLEEEIGKVAIDDPVGRKIIDVNLISGRIKRK